MERNGTRNKLGISTIKPNEIKSSQWKQKETTKEETIKKIRAHSDTDSSNFCVYFSRRKILPVFSYYYFCFLPVLWNIRNSNEIKLKSF